MALEYSKKVMEHFTNPKNVGELENPSGHAVEGSPACRDMVSIDIQVGSDAKIQDIKFKSYGCASNIATASALTEMAKNKTIDEAKKIDWKSVEEELEGLPLVKVHCSVLAVNTLRKAIENFEEKTGAVKADKSLREKVFDELRNVVNPNSGEVLTDDNVIEEGAIKDDKKVIVKLSLTEDDLYKNNIEEEIKEHLEELVEEVKVVFSKE